MKTTIGDINIYDNITVKIYKVGLIRLCLEVYPINPTLVIENRFYNQLVDLTTNYKDITCIHVSGKLFNNILGLLEHVNDADTKNNIYNLIVKGL
jgi:hypothetical protein